MQALKSKIEEACTKGTGCSCQPLRSGILSLKNITLYYTVLHCITLYYTKKHHFTPKHLCQIYEKAECRTVPRGPTASGSPRHRYSIPHNHKIGKGARAANCVFCRPGAAKKGVIDEETSCSYDWLCISRRSKYYWKQHHTVGPFHYPAKGPSSPNIPKCQQS